MSLHPVLLIYTPRSVNAFDVSGKVRSKKNTGTAITIGRRPSIMNTHCHDLIPWASFSYGCQLVKSQYDTTIGWYLLTLLIPRAANPETARARAFALWKKPNLIARSVGLYQKLKYITQQGTTPASGTPSMNRATNKPALDFTAAIDITITPQRTIIRGK